MVPVNRHGTRRRDVIDQAAVQGVGSLASLDVTYRKGGSR
jgi:hypothetical protein